jgi:hypothetical protein
MALPMPGTERPPSFWLWRGGTLILWSLAAAAIAAYTGGERFTAKLVLTFAAIIVAIHAVLFVGGRVVDRIHRR